ncbi:MAG: hypothetical protein KDB80_07570, partial [Planctomycetes bacterium]|nr:hypothetical protein [Planctomycetota bacterium]
VHDHFRIRKGVTRSLTRDVPRISAVSGGEQNFSLDAGLAHAGMSYLLLGSFGSEPGFDLGPVHVPLNPDSWTALTKERANGSRFVNTSGVLNARGRGWAALRLPPLPGVFVGTTFVHAFLAFDGTGVHFASNPVRVTIDP